ncbi:hypothetical protein OSL60_27280, partial [Escherichia coli]|nr:hypothetical protein [Escherichia coli]
VEDLLHTIERSLLQRRRREPIRLEKPGNLRGELADWLNEQFQLAPQFRYAVSGPLHLKQFFELAGKVRRPELLEAPWPGLVPAAL